MIHEQASRKITFFKKIKFDWIFSTKKRIVTNQSGRLNILEKVNYNIFLTLTGVWYKPFSQLSFRKFLWIHSGTLQGKLPPSLSPPLAPSLPTPCHQPQRPRPPGHRACPSECYEGNVLWLPLLAWGIIFLSEICRFCPPRHKPHRPRFKDDPNFPAGP